ncbi:MAG: ABC transporter ATP-binding protein [Clostridia bacterium]|nr:ABC transporter ATP-binding protein [Clostridia bacterium]
MDILTVKDLKVSFEAGAERLNAVRGIDLEIKSGEVLALVGESGSGKSVTSKAILGILPRGARIEKGSIKYRGRELTSLTESELEAIRGRCISMVPQDPFLSLDPIARVGEQIAESVFCDGCLSRSEKRRYKRQRALELMREMGIVNAEERFYEYPFRMSGGMRQRIVIAEALAPSPEILICDEPTTALDVTIEAQILDLLGGLKKDRGLSMLFITHDLGVVARIADRVAVMYAGKIVEVGTVDEIFYDPKHPYTWALMSSMPGGTEKRLKSIPGSVPDMRKKITGDAFAPRSEWAMEIDYAMEPPFFKISDTHRVASWLYHPDAPRVDIPKDLRKRIEERRAHTDGRG